MNEIPYLGQRIVPVLNSGREKGLLRNEERQVEGAKFLG